MGPEVHLKRTRAWAREEGFTSFEAEVIARADLAYDTVYRGGSSPLNMSRHFAPTAWWWARRHFRDALATGNLEQLGYALHAAQDAVSHGTLGEKHLLQMMGIGRHPDYWELAPLGIQHRIEAVTRDRLRRFRALVG